MRNPNKYSLAINAIHRSKLDLCGAYDTDRSLSVLQSKNRSPLDQSIVTYGSNGNGRILKHRINNKTDIGYVSVSSRSIEKDRSVQSAIADIQATDVKDDIEYKTDRNNRSEFLLDIFTGILNENGKRYSEPTLKHTDPNYEIDTGTVSEFDKGTKDDLPIGERRVIGARLNAYQVLSYQRSKGIHKGNDQDIVNRCVSIIPNNGSIGIPRSGLSSINPTGKKFDRIPGSAGNRNRENIRQRAKRDIKKIDRRVEILHALNADLEKFKTLSDISNKNRKRYRSTIYKIESKITEILNRK